jgi:CBS domain-containing protein
MPSYRVCFFNEIPRNNRLFRCCQRSIVIRAARSPERAIEAAKKRFARLEHIPIGRSTPAQSKSNRWNPINRLKAPPVFRPGSLAMRKMSDIVRDRNRLTLPADARVKEACRHIRDHRVGAIVVTEPDRGLVGIFTGATRFTASSPKE